MICMYLVSPNRKRTEDRTKEDHWKYSGPRTLPCGKSESTLHKSEEQSSILEKDSFNDGCFIRVIECSISVLWF